MNLNFSGGKTTFFGILFAVASLLAANPYLISSDLSQESKAWIQTIAGVIVATAGALGFAAAQNVPTQAQIQAKEEKKEQEREALKEEIHAERDSMVQEKVAAVLPAILPEVLPSVLPVVTPDVKIEAQTVTVEKK